MSDIMVRTNGSFRDHFGEWQMTGRDNRSKMAIRIDALQRLFMWHALSGVIPLYLVTEFPKSGGSWFAQMLSDYLEVPFVRNQRPPLTSLKPCVLHGHRLYSQTFKNVFCVIRDGRDIIVSAYYHLLFHNDKNPPWVVEEHRSEVPFDDYENVRKNIPAFIEYMFRERSRGLFHFRWDQFLLSWIDKEVPIIKYETMIDDTAGTLHKAIKKVTKKDPDVERLNQIADKFSFENIAKRKPGEESTRSFLRKGIAGDWKNKFTKEACKIFDHYAGDVLILLGYEKSRDWVSRQF